ncbi:MAG: hypothetical protein ACK548_18240, partial [Planctomycetota bacterium]
PAAAGAGSGPARPAGAAAPAGAVSAAPPPSASADLRVRVLAALADRPLLQGTLEQCNFTGPDADGRLVVTLQSERRMYADRLAAAGVQQDLAQAIGAAAGRALRIEWRLPAAGAGGAPAAPPAKVEPGVATKRVLGAFGGRVVQVNPEDRAPKPKEPEVPGDAGGEPPWDDGGGNLQE